ncbi:MAG: hypothetical protein ICV83_09145 [Cytophagales bacterium]|nr:hypothetical protein [Cytophagales bacterium]
MFTQPTHKNQWLAWLQRYCLVLLLSSTPGFLKGAAPAAGPTMSCPVVNTELTVLGSKYCNAVDGEWHPEAQITIKNSQKGLLYEVWSLRGGDHAYSDAVPGTGGDLTITFTAISQLHVPDAIEYYVKAYCCIEPYGCAETILTQRPIVYFQHVIPPTVNNPYVPYGGKATLTATDNAEQPEVKGFRWYAAAGGGSPLATGATFTTPSLTTSTKYYVAAYTDHCESARTEVSLCVGINANLTVIGSTLCNVLDGTILPVVTATIKNTQVGVKYQIWGGRGYYGFFGDKVEGNGGDLVISFSPIYQASMPDQFTFDVIAYGCMDDEVTLAQQAKIYLHGTIWAPSADGVTVNSGQAATLTAIPTDQYAPGVLTYKWYGTGVGGTPLATGLTFTTPALKATTTYYLAASVNGCESARVPVVVTVNGAYVRRINSGGASYTAGSKVFGADANFAGGSVSSLASGEVANTTHDGLYRTLRTGTAFSYNIPSGNGTFDVILHFNETYWGYRTGGGAGSRRFHVNLEGTRRLTNYDIFAKAGGAMRATTETLRVTVADGTLNLNFAKGLADNPAVAAVEVVAVQPPVALRVNAGGNAFSTIDARSFGADTYFSGGSVSAATTLGIVGTADDYLYQTGRHGASFAYNFPTGNGSYDVVLHFAETYYGNTAPGGVGSRKFHVDMEGVRRLTNYDVFARAGGALKVAQETFRVNVSDGTLNVTFLKGAADNPAVKAIEVLPAGSGLTINAGGSAFTTAAGKRFSPDVYFANGTISSLAAGEVAGTTDDVLYRTLRTGVAFSYGLPSGNGTFDVILHFNETWFGHRTGGGAGSRRFNVDIEGKRWLTNYDIFATAGGAMKAVKQSVRIEVTDGTLNLFFSKGLADNPAVAAIEVVPVTVAGAREVAATSVAGGAEDVQVSLYPNPVRENLTVKLPFAARQVTGTTVVTATGEGILQDGHRVKGEYELEIPVGSLKPGLYLLRLRSAHGQQVVRFVKGN